MNVLLYSEKGNESGIKILNTVSGVVPEEKLLIVHNIEDLTSAFRLSNRSKSLMILHLNKENDIAKFIDLRHLWEDLCLIVIADEYDEKTVSNCYKLYPRLVVHSAGSLHEVIAVIRKKTNSTLEKNDSKAQLSGYS